MRRLSTSNAITFAFCLLTICFLSVSSHAQAAQLKLLGQLDPFEGNGRYADIWGEGNYAYLGSNNGSGVMIIDISNPTAPKMVGYYNPAEGGRFQDVIVKNGIGYFASENRGGVHVVDVRNPSNPVLLKQISEDQNGYPNVHELALDNGILYEADARTNKVKVIDVRDPRNPVFVRDIQTTETRFIHSAIAVNGRLFTSGFFGQMDIYDVRNVLTAAPPRLGSFDAGTAAHSSFPSNDGKLLASARENVLENGDVRLYDISNPAQPVLLSSITAQFLGIDAATAHNPYIVGNLLFVSWYQAGLVVVDITNPRQPRFVGNYDTYSGNSSAALAGCWGVYPFLGVDRVLISDRDGGLFVVDATAALTGPKTVSAASYTFSAIAPRSIVSAFGLKLAATVQIATATPLPTSLAGSSVTVQDSKGIERLAPLYFVSPTQINYQIPPGTMPGPALIRFGNGGQTTIGAVIIQVAAPTIFTVDASGSGPAAALDALTFAGAPFNATRAGGQPNVIAVFGTGFGEDATDLEANVAESTLAMLDGQAVAVLYAGQSPGFVGLNQLNILFPPGISSGKHTLTVMRNGLASNMVTITVR